jgi:SNF2 family DNA or RNA helicase
MLYQHQKTSVNFFKSTPKACDFSDPGTGKTRVQIELLKDPSRRKALILAPKSILYSTWAEDISKFAPELTFSVATAANRQAAFQKEADVYITNHDAVKFLLSLPATFWKPFKTLIVDEASAFKHPTAQRSKALAKLRVFFEYRYILTGTPCANTVLDLWHLVYLVDDGQRLGKSYYFYRSQVCTPIPGPGFTRWVDKADAELKVAERIKDITMRHKLEECVDLPPTHLYVKPFYLTPKQYKVYRDLSRDHLAFLQDEAQVSAINAAAVVTKLLQIASGAVYDSEGVARLIATERYDLILELIEERKHSIVFFHWRHQRDELSKRLLEADIPFRIIDGETSAKEAIAAVELFQKGFLRVLLLHPQSAAHGLTLTKATTAIWTGPTYNLEHFLQGNRRIVRISQTQKTEIIMIVAKNTIEELVYDRLLVKDKTQTNLLSILQDAVKQLELIDDRL